MTSKQDGKKSRKPRPPKVITPTTTNTNAQPNVSGGSQPSSPEGRVQ